MLYTQVCKQKNIFVQVYLKFKSSLFSFCHMVAWAKEKFGYNKQS